MWVAGSNYQKLSLKDVRVEIRIGLLPEERAGPQTVVVDVELYRRHDRYRGEGIGGCMDYDPIYRYVTEEWPKRDHNSLIEAWAEDLVNHCFRDDNVEACLVRIQKPDIYPGTAVPAIEVVRHRPASDTGHVPTAVPGSDPQL